MSKKERDEAVENEEKNSERNDSTESMRILEALLFASEELLTVTKIKSILPDNPDARSIRKIVEKINAQLQKERHPFEIVEIGGGYQFRTVAYYHPWVRQIFKEKAAKKLSIQALECLAIIAYKQPISKAEIEAVRGVVSDGAMKTLLERRLVTIAGRSDKPGRPLLYGTTTEFLKYFGLNKMEDLPKIEEFEAIAREKVDELSLEELQKENDMESELDSENIENPDNVNTDAVQAESDGNAVGESTDNPAADEHCGDGTAEKESEDSAETGSGEIDTDSYGEIDNEDEEKLPEDSDGLQYVPEPESTALFEIDISEDTDEIAAEAKTENEEDAADSEIEEIAADQDVEESAWDTQDFDEKFDDDTDKFVPRGAEELSNDDADSEETDVRESRNGRFSYVHDQVNDDEYMEETAEINKETIRIDAYRGTDDYATPSVDNAGETESRDDEEEILEVFLDDIPDEETDSDSKK